MDKKMLFVFNPLSGKAQIRTKLMDILDVFVKAGYHVEVHVTQRALDAKRVVEERGYDMDLIVGSGGDGTLNEVVSGVMGMERRPYIGYIPAGTTNDFAASHKIPRNMIVNSRKKKNIIWMKWKKYQKMQKMKMKKVTNNLLIKTMEVTSNEFSMA